MTHKAHSHTQVVGHTHTVPAPAETPTARRRRGTGFWLAFFAYLILSLFSLRAMGLIVWGLLAFLTIPVLTGILTGRLQGTDVGAGSRFMAGLRAAGIPMALYTAISLMIVHSRVGPSPAPFATFLVGVFVSCVYALLAGLVAGATALLSARQQA